VEDEQIFEVKIKKGNAKKGKMCEGFFKHGN
jgi:hypothetical protein